MAIILDWKIRATQARCELTEIEFVDGQEFYTCIFDDPESDGFLRKDYAIESWEKIRDEIKPPPFSFWRSTYKAPVKEDSDKKIDDHSVEGMLRRFIEEDDSRTENARYILALMLERKKTLIPTDVQQTETRRLLFYEHEETSEVFVVADPQLKLDEIELVQQEVADLLAAEERRVEGGAVEENDSTDDSESPADVDGGEEAPEEEKDRSDQDGEDTSEAE
ncbi:MAG: hypothetical protein P1U87_07525 [Verrucomicrobiales bacterium]|nr:hypothetical protein [Verrucomicrobiales bacterium]